MCSKSGGTAITQQTPAPAAMGAYNNVLNRAQGVANLPYQPYGGELTADINPQQQLGIGNINQYAGAAVPYFQQAAGMVQSGASPLTAGDIQNYYNPYNQDVIRATQGLFNQQNAQQQEQLKGNAAAQGALGGDRAKIAQAVLAGQQQLSQAPTLAGLESAGYNQAVQTAMAQKANQLQGAYGLGNVGAGLQGAALQGAGAQFGVGTAEQQTEQARLSALYQQFINKQAFPYQQAQWLAGIDTSIAPQLGYTQTTQGPPPNPYNALAGLSIAGLAAFAKRGGRIRGFDTGGTPYGGGQPYNGVSPMPYAGGNGYIPMVQMQAPQPHSAPPQSPMGSPNFDPVAFAKQIANGSGGIRGLGDSLGENIGIGGINNPLTAYGPEGGIVSAGNYEEGAAEGGRIRGFEDGGTPFDERFNAAYDAPPLVPEPIQDVSSQAMDAWRAGVDSDIGRGNTAQPVGDFQGPEMPGADRAALAAAKYQPGAARERADPETIAQLTQPAGGYSQVPMGQELGGDQPIKRSGLGSMFGLSPEAKMGLMAAGLGIAASRSPWFGSAVGEGGLAGISQYHQSVTQKQKQQSIDEAVKRLDAQLKHQGITEQQGQQRIDLERERFGVPPGFRKTPSGLEPIPGGPHDPSTIESEAKAKLVSRMSPEAVEIAARQIVHGDFSGMSNLGTGRQKDETVSAIRNKAAEILMGPEYGLSAKEAAEHVSDQLQRFKARGIGMNSEERTLGTREANLGLILRVTKSAIPAALARSEDVQRLGWRKPNEIIQAGQVMADSPELKLFGMANLQLAESWARAMNPTGVMRESDRDLALKFLSTAENKDTYRKLVMQLQDQINREIAAVKEGRERPLGQRKPGASEGEEKQGQSSPTSASKIPAPPPGFIQQ